MQSQPHTKVLPLPYSLSPYYYYHHHNYPQFITIFSFQVLILQPVVKMSACFLHHEFSPLLSGFSSNTDYPSPHTVRIADRLLCLPSVAVSKHPPTIFMLIYSLISTLYSVSNNESTNKTTNVCTTYIK